MNGVRRHRIGRLAGVRAMFIGLAFGWGFGGTAQAAVIRADALALGAVVYDSSWLWNGEVVQWRVVHHGYAGAPGGSVTLRAVESIGTMALIDTGWNNRWPDASMRTYLNTTFHGAFSDDFKAITQETSVSWALSNPVNSPSSGVTTDRVFIASRTELGGPALTGDGLVLDWFSDGATAADRRAPASDGIWYWTRTGERTTFDFTPYDMTAYRVDPPTGAFAAGSWTSDAGGTMPVLNIRGDARFVEQGDGSFQLIPEPGTAGLLLLAGAGFLGHWRRRFRR
jgi:hypothetical protein